MTLVALLWFGVKRERAFELSFLMSLPAVFGALILEAPHALRSSGSAASLGLGTLVSFVVGIGALYLLRGVLIRGRLSLFAIYLFPLALATLAWGYARP